MNPQRELFLPRVPTNDSLRERIKDLERQVIAAESRGDDAECQRLYKERDRLRTHLAPKKPSS